MSIEKTYLELTGQPMPVDTFIRQRSTRYRYIESRGLWVPERQPFHSSLFERAMRGSQVPKGWDHH